jgi:hypothetical protein
MIGLGKAATFPWNAVHSKGLADALPRRFASFRFGLSRLKV